MIVKHAQNQKGAVQGILKRARLIAFILLVTAAPVLMASGCYGSFPLTRTVYEVNGEITDEKIIHSIVLWIFILLPVYGLAMLVDFVVLNLVEFWSGDEVEISQVETEDGAVIALGPGAEPNVAILTVSREGEVLSEMRFVRVENGVCKVFENGDQLTGWVFVRENGTIELADAEKRVVRTFDRMDIRAMRMAMAE